MPKRSAGLLVWRRGPDGVEVLLGHPGGPLFARKDTWTLPKGEYQPSEDPRAAADREFTEETGFPPPSGPALPLGEVVQRGGKVVTAWAVEGDLDAAQARSNTFTMQWPPRSGLQQEFPELDRLAWFGLDLATERVFPAQVAFLERLREALTR